MAYNFLELTRVDHAAMEVVMGSMKYVTFLGEDFNKWVFPICLVLMVLLTAFNVYGRLLTCIGLSRFQFGFLETGDMVDEGQYIIDNYKNENLLLLSTDDENESPLKGKEPRNPKSSVQYEKVKLEGKIVVDSNNKTTSSEECLIEDEGEK